MAVQVRVEGMPAPVVGRLARIAPAAEPGTRSIGVTIALDNPKETLRAGQYALARVELPDDTKRLTVPLTALSSTSGQDQVWVIADGALLRRAVTLGRRDDAKGRVEVLGGLTDDAQVLGVRFDNLREGAKALVVAGKSRKPDVASSGNAAPLR
jgi:multidrug efflux pump subunit AcrA (membrane-fusion protein)